MWASRKKTIILPGIFLSLILHALVGFALFVAVQFDTATKISQTIIQTRLVHLGKPRKKELLPQKAPVTATQMPAGPKATKQSKSSKVATKKKKITPKRKKATRKKRPNARYRLSQITKNWSKEGANNGSPIGTEIRGRLQQEYEDQVAQAIRDSYELPSILSENERKNLEVMVKIKIGSQGRLLNISILKSSLAPFFDNAVVDGAKSLGSFGPPPLQLRSKFAHIGIQLKFCPINCSKG